MTRQSLWMLTGAFLALALVAVHAQPALVQFNDCFSGNASQHMNVSRVYAQLLNPPSGQQHINLTVFGTSPQQIVGQTQESNNLATLFTSTDVLTLDVWDTRSAFCDTIRPPSPLPPLAANATSYCPVDAGEFAFSSYIPMNGSHELTTLITRLRAVDPFSQEVLCVDVYTSPLDPGAFGSIYGHAIVIFWGSVALAIAYWLIVGIARIVTAWERGATRAGTGVWSRVVGGGFILASALSGERFAVSPALLRFCTPSLRDIIFHTQWCAALAMVAVQWPRFVYPIFAQVSWATLSYNVTITQSKNAEHWNPLHVPPFNPPAAFTDQVNDPTSVLYVNQSAPNTFFMVPYLTEPGIASFAVAVGLRPQDLFGVCLSIFLALVAGAIVLSILARVLDWVVSPLASPAPRTAMPASRIGTRSPGMRYSASKDMLDAPGAPDEERSFSSHFLMRIVGPPTHGWRRRFFRAGSGSTSNSFHGSVLHGNLVRLVILFHFPVTIFACYQMTLGRAHASLVSIVLAALSFVFISVLIPVLLIVRLTLTTTNKLYDETGTLLALGPLYNHYRHGSQLFACIFFATNIAFGLTIGCGQRSGTAQAIVILVIEVASALGTSVWLPWGQGASMGLISFLFCVARIVIAVLLVILTPIVSIGEAAGGWVAYAILCILGLVYLAFILLFLVKLVEAGVRIFGGVGFDRSRHVIDSGLLGACGMLGCCGGRTRRRSRRRRYRASQVPRSPGDDAFTLPSGSVGYAGGGPHAHANGGGLGAPAQAGPPSSPPSVLRPEHAMQPYKEESDDEGGYIMRAWQPFPLAHYSAVDAAPGSPEPAPAAAPSGFARVGGGRAHYDSPYAIAGGSRQSFPSVEGLAPGAAFAEDDPGPTASLTSVARHATTVRPPGAMPLHGRKKSQTAIIEDMSALALADAAAGRVHGHGQERSPSVDDALLSDDDRWSDMTEQPKKKSWFNLRKNRRHSEGVDFSRSSEGSTSVSPEAPGRSFVVVRKGAPGARPQAASADGHAETTQRPSFQVLRGSTSGTAPAFARNSAS